MVVGPGGIVIAVPEQLSIDLHPSSTIVLSDIVIEGASERDLLVGIGFDGEAVLSAGQPSGFQVMHLELALRCLVDFSDSGSCPPQIVGVRPHSA